MNAESLIPRLVNSKQFSYKELVFLAENIGYTRVSKTGSHDKYERPNSPSLVIVASQKRAASLHQYRIEKALRILYTELSRS